MLQRDPYLEGMARIFCVHTPSLGLRAALYSTTTFRGWWRGGESVILRPLWVGLCGVLRTYFGEITTGDVRSKVPLDNSGNGRARSVGKSPRSRL